MECLAKQRERERAASEQERQNERMAEKKKGERWLLVLRGRLLIANSEFFSMPKFELASRRKKKRRTDRSARSINRKQYEWSIRRSSNLTGGCYTVCHCNTNLFISIHKFFFYLRLVWLSVFYCCCKTREKNFCFSTWSFLHRIFDLETEWERGVKNKKAKWIVICKCLVRQMNGL